jgi:23S rRNA (guanosine2251-2'-O)-methyltransferase
MKIFGRNVMIRALETKQKISELHISQGAHGEAIDKIKKICKAEKIVYQEADTSKLDKLAGAGNVHQGVFAEMDFNFLEVNDLISKIKNLEQSFIIILDQITDPHNVGAIIRTAEAAGAIALVLTEKNSADISSTVIKVSAGSVFNLPIVKLDEMESLIDKLKGIHVQCIATDGLAEKSMYETQYENHVALIIGNEEIGIRKAIKKRASSLINIPIFGTSESLNASVAAGICMYHIRAKQLKKF